MLRQITDKQLRQKLGGCSEMTIWRLRRDGKLPKPRKLGSRNVTPEDEADEAIANLVGLTTVRGSREAEDGPSEQFPIRTDRREAKPHG